MLKYGNNRRATAVLSCKLEACCQHLSLPQRRVELAKFHLLLAEYWRLRICPALLRSVVRLGWVCLGRARHALGWMHELRA